VLKKYIQKKKLLPKIKEKEAFEYVIKNAVRGGFITICSNLILNALDQIIKLKE